MEKVNLIVFKQILSVRQQTSNATLYREMGRYPLVILRNIYIIKYWRKICNSLGTLIHRIYNKKDEDGNYINDFRKNVNDLL